MKVLPSNRWARAVVVVAALAVYSLLMWWYVFPWADRTYVNRPAFESTTFTTPAPSPSASETDVPSTPAVSPS